jgi:hypothetical protein
LQVGRAGLVDGFRTRRLKVGHAAWDAEHTILARDAVQAGPVVRLLGPPLRSFLVPHLDDDDARLELGHDGQLATLTTFAGRVIGLARAVDAVRPGIPVPAWFSATGEAWEHLAAELGGTLERGTCSIHDGRLEGGTLAIVHAPGIHGPSEVVVGHAPATGLAIKAPLRLTPDAQGQLGAAELPARLVQELRRIGALRLEIERDQLHLARPAVVRPSELAATITVVRDLAATFRPRAGAFR